MGQGEEPNGRYRWVQRQGPGPIVTGCDASAVFAARPHDATTSSRQEIGQALP